MASVFAGAPNYPASGKMGILHTILGNNIDIPLNKITKGTKKKVLN